MGTFLTLVKLAEATAKMVIAVLAAPYMVVLGFLPVEILGPLVVDKRLASLESVAATLDIVGRILVSFLG